MILNKHYYNRLDLSHQILYKKIYEALKKHEEYLLCGENECTKEQCLDIIRAIVSDEPGFFYVDVRNLVMEKTNWGINKIKPKYFLTKIDREKLDKEIQNQAKKLVEECSVHNSDTTEIIKKLHDILIENVEITTECGSDMNNHTIVGALLEKKTTCEGIALLYKYILNKLGIECEVLYGELCSDVGAMNLLHVWNRVSIYGESKNVDIAADSIRSGFGEISYDYFCVSNSIFLKDHKILDEELNDFYLKQTKKEKFVLDMEKNVGLEKVELESNIFDVEEEKLLERGIKVLENVLQTPLLEKVYDYSKELSEQLSAVKKLISNYPDCEDEFRAFIESHLNDVLQMIKEYYRYTKIAADGSITILVYERVVRLMKEFSEAIKNNVSHYSCEIAGAMLQKISGIQQDLEQEQVRKRKWPFELDVLENQTDIEIFISAFAFFCGLDLPKDLLYIMHFIHNDLGRMKKAIVDNEEKKEKVSQFLCYYLPEAVSLVVMYDECRYSGVDIVTLEKTQSKLSSSLYRLSDAIRNELDELHRYELMEMNARAEALKDILEQDGFVDPAFRIK